MLFTRVDWARIALAEGGKFRLPSKLPLAKSVCWVISRVRVPSSQFWIVVSNVRWRNLILRIHWDDQGQPSVESPLGDFLPAAGTVLLRSHRSPFASILVEPSIAIGKCRFGSEPGSPWKTAIRTNLPSSTTRLTIR